MSLLPFANQAGQRVIRWPVVVLCWMIIMASTLFGSAMSSYMLTGEWHIGSMGIWMGVLLSASFTYYGLTRPVDKLPPMQPRSSSGVGNG